MTMTIASVTPAEAQRLIANGATLVDIREPDEHARERIPGAINVPVAQLDRLNAQGNTLVFHCRSGARTQTNGPRLAAVASVPGYILAGGLDAWRRDGLPVATDWRQPLEIMRQVQLVSGGIVLLGIALGL